jgi:hypothetical protein
MGLSQLEGKWGKPIEQTVGYLKAWGRLDLLESGEDADTQDLIGTIFSADVKLKTGSEGDVKVNLTNILPISHAEAPAPAPKAAPAPAMRRGR